MTTKKKVAIGLCITAGFIFAGFLWFRKFNRDLEEALDQIELFI